MTPTLILHSLRPEGALDDRPHALLNTPFVHSDTAGDIQPHRPNVNGLGPILRVGLWNIERGLNFDEIRSALSDPGAFLRMTRMTSVLARGKPSNRSLPRCGGLTFWS